MPHGEVRAWMAARGRSSAGRRGRARRAGRIAGATCRPSSLLAHLYGHRAEASSRVARPIPNPFRLDQMQSGRVRGRRDEAESRCGRTRAPLSAHFSGCGVAVMTVAHGRVARNAMPVETRRQPVARRFMLPQRSQPPSEPCPEPFATRYPSVPQRLPAGQCWNPPGHGKAVAAFRTTLQPFQSWCGAGANASIDCNRGSEAFAARTRVAG